MTSSFMKEFEHLKIQLEEIKRATNSFSSRVIGKGGFGAVYEGEVSHSMGRRSIVAIKRLNRQFGQGEAEFLKEITLLSRCTHQNLISLLGFCDEEGEKVLVYEFASKGSLDRHLSDPDLTWVERIKICLGAAKGLCYLHDPKGRHQRVLHCDIKSANVLLDESLTAKVADFGLSKMGPANQQYSLLVTNAVGTAGYCDPLFMTTYTLTKESDVYSFGVVLFEVLCGRLCYEYSNGQTKVFVNVWKEKYSKNKLNEIVFQHLKPQMDPTSLELFSDVAFRCLDNYREGRPTMSIVVEKLEKALEFQELYDLKLPEGYMEIVNATVTPLRFKSIDELNQLLSTGVFLNAGKTWLSRNDHGEHFVMISLEECLTSEHYGSDTPQYSTGYDSRFKVGCYSTNCLDFKTHVKTQFLSPLITYRVNLVFKFKKRYKHEYLSLKYTLKGEKKVLVVRLANNREDEWLKASLYQFTSNERTVDLEIYFDTHYHCDGLEIEGIEFQPLEKVEVKVHEVLEYEEILKAATHPLLFKSEAELNAILSKGIFFDEGKTWFSRNDHGEHYVMISLAKCLIPTGSGLSRYSAGYDSRFEVGCYSTKGEAFKTRVKTQFLSPLITYRVNLVFKLKRRDQPCEYDYLQLKYNVNEEEKVSIVHLANKREDEWLKAGLYQFTSLERTVDLKIDFYIQNHGDDLHIEGIEFQPLEKVEVEFHRLKYGELKYGEILEAAAHPLIFISEAEINALLSKGVLLNEGRTWFSRNDKGVHYVFKSMKECLIEEAGESYDYVSGYNSRFPTGSVELYWEDRFKTCVKTEFLSPLMTYTVNLVFKFSFTAKQGLIWLYYKLAGEMHTRVSHFAYMREDNWWTIELFHFTSDGTTVDLEIIFEPCLDDCSVIVDGIEFQPLEVKELQVLEDDKKHVSLEPTLSDNEDDTYWKNKLPTDYKDIIKFSEESLQWKTNKELYYTLSEGLLINYKPSFSFFQQPSNYGQQWFCLDKNGKTCLMLPATTVFRLKTSNWWEWKSLPESRFGKGLVISSSDCYKYIVIKENKFQVLSPQTEYACYLVYKTESKGGCTSPIVVLHKDLGSSEWEYASQIYLVSPQTPVIRPKAGQNTHNPLYRPKLKGIPQQRSDGWMEVQVWEFQTDTTMTVIPSLNLECQTKYPEGYLKGLIIMGIEFRPI